MIELFTADTPNGWKVCIMLEEIEFKYKLTKVNLSGDQFKPEFKKISPFNKIPVIIDHENNNTVFGPELSLCILVRKVINSILNQTATD